MIIKRKLYSEKNKTNSKSSKKLRAYDKMGLFLSKNIVTNKQRLKKIEDFDRDPEKYAKKNNKGVGISLGISSEFGQINQKIINRGKLINPYNFKKELPKDALLAVPISLASGYLSNKLLNYVDFKDGKLKKKGRHERYIDWDRVNSGKMTMDEFKDKWGK